MGISAVSLVGVITLGIVPAAVAGNPDRPAVAVLPVATGPPKDPRVCDGYRTSTPAERATKCSTQVAMVMSWKAAMKKVGHYTPYAPECAPAGTLKFRCLIDNSPGVIAVSWDPVTFKPTVTVGRLAVKVLAATKARVAAAIAADQAG